MLRRGQAFLVLIEAAVLAGLAACAADSRRAGAPGLIEDSILPGRHLPETPSLLETGRTAYRKHCGACHGESGDGEGEAAYLLYPRPRDFTRGEYRLVSTWEGVPTDEDLFRTISRGMPGSAMPSWAHLPEETRWGLVHYVKSLAREPWMIIEARDPPGPLESGAGPIELPPEPGFPSERFERARGLFLTNCAPCHGTEGKGDGVATMVDSRGFPTQPRDLTAGVFKGSPEPDQVYRRLVTGLPGSPMPANPALHGEDGWDLAHYVLSLSSPEQRAKVEMKRFRIVGERVRELPSHPDSGTWQSVEAVNLHLMPLWWRPERPEEISVRALHDGKELALLLVWGDPTYDHTAIRPQDFRDAAAVEFALEPDPPFFAMGDKGGAVNIWMWKSERQADLEVAFQEVESIYPNLGIDSYPNFLRSPLEQPARRALTLESDPTFVTGWGAGNIVSDPTRGGRAAEDLSAEGFGTLRARPPLDQEVEAVGLYRTGSYRVMFRRRLESRGSAGVDLEPGRVVPVAFAAWNGSAGDRDGKKSVTIWQELVIER